MSQVYNLQQEILEYFTGKKISGFKYLPDQTLSELGLYKSLSINSLQDYLERLYSNCFILLEDKSREICLDYFHHYPSLSPVYNQIAKNFPTFLASKFFKNKYNYPNYLPELALYEWLDLEVDIAPNKLNFSNGLNSSVKVINFSFDLSSIIEFLHSKDINLEDKLTSDVEEEKIIVVFFRDPETLVSKNLTINEKTAEVILGLGQEKELEEILEELLSQTDLPKEQVKTSFNKLIDNLKNLKILLD